MPSPLQSGCALPWGTSAQFPPLPIPSGPRFNALISGIPSNRTGGPSVDGRRMRYSPLLSRSSCFGPYKRPTRRLLDRACRQRIVRWGEYGGSRMGEWTHRSSQRKERKSWNAQAVMRCTTGLTSGMPWYLYPRLVRFSIARWARDDNWSLQYEMSPRRHPRLLTGGAYGSHWVD
ncbi:hypothetical protein BJ322DRAFT_889783 [Thelephora terrestris]|uniref:Uncharacterized protein n=1 Tax=Thelephora terrestris TaxID=56493 RepID=A0A9P6HCD7_9AGAM|nr:hypothetical protein BJ322DRAFT_889783 [Thelephora terrestris]